MISLSNQLRNAESISGDQSVRGRARSPKPGWQGRFAPVAFSVFVLSDHAIFRQNRELAARQPKFAAEDVHIVLADQRRPSGKPPRRSVVYGRLARIDEATAEFRMLHVFPEAAVMQVEVVEQRFRGTHRTPGE